MAKTKRENLAAIEGLVVEQWPIGRLVGYPGNPRKNDGAVDRMCEAITEFGFRIPIVATSAGLIVDGHLRHKAALKLGIETVPVALADDLTEAQIRAFRLLANQSANWAEWDVPLLKLELEYLKISDFPLELTGFDDIQLVSFMSGLPAEDPAPEQIPEAPANPVTRPGDIWVMGHHRLMCGDCRNPSHVAQLIGRRKINVAFTSPPYAEQREYDVSSGFEPIPPERYVEWFAPVAANMAQHLAADGSWFVNIKPSAEGLDTSLYVMDLVIAHVRHWGWHFATEFCWERLGVPKSVTRRFKNQFEPVYQFSRGEWKMRPDAVRHESDSVPRAGGPGVGQTSWKSAQGGNGPMFGAAKLRRHGTTELMSESQGTPAQPGEYIGPGLAYPGNRIPPLMATHEALGHAAAFPVGLPAFFIQAYSDAGDVVVDPFMGSGSTLIAAEQTGRVGMGFELSATYVDVSVERWMNLTGPGKQATLLDTKQTFAEIAKERGH